MPWHLPLPPARVALACAILGILLATAPEAGSSSTTRAPRRRAPSTSDIQALLRLNQPPSPSDTVVARVGDRFITLAGFRKEWSSRMPNERPVAPDQATAYRVFLDDLVNRELLGIEAARHPRRLTGSEQADLDSFWRAEMRNRLYFETIDRRVQLDTTQLDRYRNELSWTLTLDAYGFPTREAAQAWYTRIVGGVAISKLDAATESSGPDAPRRMHWEDWNRENFDEATARVAFALAPGRLSAPALMGGKWVLLRLIRSSPRRSSTVLAGRTSILFEQRRILSAEYKQVFRDSLARAIQVRYDDAGLDTLVNRFLVLPVRTTPREGGGASFNMFQPLPTLTARDSAAVLSRSLSGQVTGADLLRYLTNTPSYLRPEIRNREQLRAWVDRVAFDRELLAQAVARGLDRHPEVVRATARHRERHWVEALYADSITSRVHVSEADLRGLYQADSSRWNVPETVGMWVCALPSRAQADSILRVVRGGGDRKQIAYDLSSLESADAGGMIEPFPRGGCPVPEIEAAVFATPVDSLGGPVSLPVGWVIFQVLERKPGQHRSFDESHDDLALTIRNEREELALQEMLARLRQRFGVEVHQDRLPQL